MNETDRVKAESVVNAWVWQPAEGHNYKYQHATNSLTRYYESASMQPDEIKLVIEYLKSQEIGSAGISLMNRKVDMGTGWRAKDAWYQTTPGERWANTESTKVRIYQILIQTPENQSGDGPYTVEDGCQYKVEHTFYWDVETLPTLPSSESGVQYTMQGLTRDRETGLYSCVIEKRTRIQQDVAEYLKGETAFQKEKNEQHIGVRQQNVNGTGKRASVSNGKIVTREVTKNPDCTSNVENRTIEEKPVIGAVIEYRKTLRGTVERRVDRSQAAPLSNTGMKIGEIRRSEETEGERWNNETQVPTHEPAGIIGKGCSRSQMTHADTTTENVANEPTVEQTIPEPNREIQKEARKTEEGTWDVSTRRIVYTQRDTGIIVGGSSTTKTQTRVGINQLSVPSGGRGGQNVVKRFSAQPNEHGSFSTSEETTTYEPEKKTVKGGTTSQQETVESGINQTEIPKTSPSINRRDEVSVSLNDHGSMSTQRRIIIYRPESRTASGGTTSQQETVTVGTNQTSVPSTSPGINRRDEVNVSLNEHGSMSTQRRMIVYLPESKTASGGTASQREVLVVGTNQTEVPVGSPGINRRDEVNVSINDHGSMSTHHRMVIYEPKTSGMKRWSDENFVYTHETYRNLASPKLPTGTNDIASASFQINDHGSFDGSVSTRNSKASTTRGDVLAFSCSSSVESEVTYKNRSGQLCKRKVTADLDVYYGKLSSVINHVMGKTDTKGPGKNVGVAGWYSGWDAKGIDMAMGKRYTNIQWPGNEIVIGEDQESGSNAA